MNYTGTRLLLEKYGFMLKKKYGQNFLIDENVLESITEAAELSKDITVLEIGPGIGTLTQYLCESARKVVAVEIDRNLIPILDEVLKPYDNVEVINRDIMKTDTDALFADEPAGTLKVVANLPYYITTPVMIKLIEGSAVFDHMIFMIQKEVADRIQAAPGTKEYGALSLAVKYFADVRVIGTVPPECFIPRPKVESTIISLKRHKTPLVDTDKTHLFKIIRASFNQRRKTLANAIENFEGLDYTREDVQAALEAAGLDENIRGEKLSLQEFAMVSDHLFHITK